MELPALPPGLVGSHCIGVDPVLPDAQAEMLGCHAAGHPTPAGASNDSNMGKYVAEQTVKQMIANDLPVRGARCDRAGHDLQENRPDIRNSKVIDVVRELQSQRAGTARAASWEGDHVADRLGAGHQHDQAVQAEGQAAVRRRAVLQRVEQEAELAWLRAPMFSARNTLLCTSARWIRTEPPPSSQPLSTMS